MEQVFAPTLGQVASSLANSFKPLGRVLIGVAYLSGIGFAIGSVFKFKQHKDNPTQIPIGTGFALLAIAIILVFLPSIFKPAGKSIFGTNPAAGGFTGSGVNCLPGVDQC